MSALGLPGRNPSLSLFAPGNRLWTGPSLETKALAKDTILILLLVIPAAFLLVNLQDDFGGYIDNNFYMTFLFI